ncbi:Acetyltransferase (GNAT) domain-containing protein [Salegentibacter holothuriorum]|uniref:Acetyltransferase (GNAT) domain-containing protein n=1 Tax=Salegentibacter holothuriorum TaxID=241145 RepID=A0A1T5AQ23_9FLAO|nr:GNAT family N-acetyltransferase [Salegentibacter holothuriorum]SKB36927.1 Acetyltransferase (GNAT) domain-containing protein [Salegentibacter holothuriorum]
MKSRLRNLKKSDLNPLFIWRNHPLTQLNSFDKKEILFADHKKWFNGILGSNLTATYILETEEVPVGVIRFDIETEDQRAAKISYLIDPLKHGKGLGTKILERGIKKISQENKKLDKVFGYVLRENLASIRIFEKLAFIKVSEDTSELKFEKSI